MRQFCLPATLSVAFAIGGLFATAVEAAPEQELWPNSHLLIPVDEKRISAIMAKMTLKEKVGQMVMAEIRHINPKELKRFPLGGILNGGGAFPNYNKQAPISDWVELADKYHRASGTYRWQGTAIPLLWGTDAVHGHSNVYGATIFPHNIGLGATANVPLLREIGRITAAEVAATGLYWTFAPTVAVPRDDRWGRTYEGYSELPQLVARFGRAMVEGLQGSGTTFMDDGRVLATAKHFIGDGGTYKGVDQGDTRLSEAELKRLHGEGYVQTLQAGVQTVMASFNSWNGKKLHGHRYLLTEVLKEKMGFDGFVVGDWNGHGQIPGCDNGNCAEAINAGVDMIMVPEDWEKYFNNTLKQAKNGKIPMARVDDAVRRIIRVKMRAGLFADKGPTSRANAGNQKFIGNPSHRAVARQAVRESLVLLKNNGRVLPLNPKSQVLVVGEAARQLQYQMGGWSLTWQGTGNNNSDFPGATSIYDGIAAAVSQAGGSVEYSAKGSYSKKPQVAVVVYGEAPYAEGQGDLKNLQFSEPDAAHLKILRELRRRGIKTVSLFISGRPMWVNPELNASDAFVAVWLPGSEGGGIADVLFCPRGDSNCDFKGRLPYSWPAKPEHGSLNAEDGKKALFRLGYGLTYADNRRVRKLSEKIARKPRKIDRTLLRGWPQEPYELLLQEGKLPPAVFDGQQVATRQGGVKVSISSHRVQEDALAISFAGKTLSALMLRHQQTDDWSEATEKDASLALSVRFNRLDASRPLHLSVSCGPGCRGGLTLSEHFSKSDLNTWRNVHVDLKCLEKQGLNPAVVALPMVLVTEGKWSLELGEVKLTQEPVGSKLLPCP